MSKTSQRKRAWRVELQEAYHEGRKMGKIYSRRLVPKAPSWYWDKSLQNQFKLGFNHVRSENS